MKLWSLSLTLLVTCVAVSSLLAVEENERPKRLSEQPGTSTGRFQEALKRFDKNGDGQLNEQERAEARRAMEQFRSKGGGPRSDSAGRPAINREELLKKFDENANGRIDENEKQAVMQYLRQQGIVGGRPEAKDQPALEGRPQISKEELLRRIDKNGNGQIDEDERTAVQQFIGRLRGGNSGPEDHRVVEMLKQRFDGDGDGELNPEERKAARAARDAIP